MPIKKDVCGIKMVGDNQRRSTLNSLIFLSVRSMGEIDLMQLTLMEQGPRNMQRKPIGANLVKLKGSRNLRKQREMKTEQ